MNHTDDTRNDPLAGYVGSVVLAMLLSNVLADLIVGQLGKVLTLDSAHIWHFNLAAGLFLGIAAANPVGALMQKTSYQRMMTRFLLGYLAGVVVQMVLITPVAGGGVSPFLFLFIALMMIPMILGVTSIRGYLEANEIVLRDEFALRSVQVMNLPERVVIIAVMMLTFALLWSLGASVQSVLVAISGVLLATTIHVAFPRSIEKGEELWPDLAALEQAQEAVTTTALRRFGELAATILPGAILLGGISFFAFVALQDIYPELAGVGSGAQMMLETIGIVVLSGLGVVLFGMLSALGFGLALLMLFGRLAKWDAGRLRATCFRLIRLMCFRPINPGR